MRIWIFAAVWALSAAASRTAWANPKDSEEPAGIEERGETDEGPRWGRNGRNNRRRMLQEFLGGHKGGENRREEMKERREMRAKLREARRRYLEAKDVQERKTLRAELEKAVGAEMDWRLKRLETRLQKLRDRLPVLERKLAVGKKNRDKLVKLRVDLVEAEGGKAD